MELLDAYKSMYRARAFELALAELWRQGLVSGEMHLGTGEEAIAAGVVPHVEKGDAVAVDHRGTPVFNLLGVDLTLMLKEMLGREDGLCGGRGGHMHLFSPERLTASSGIVGSSAPLAAGFALAAKRLHPGRVAVAFFGEGACNQGMLLEALNLAAAWSLPAIFVCKDNGWAITTRSPSVTGGDLLRRAQAFGLAAAEADGLDVAAVFETARRAFQDTRRGGGPRFLRFTCSRLDGHFLGDELVRTARKPVAERLQTLAKIIPAAFARRGGGLGERAEGIVLMLRNIKEAGKARYDKGTDPLARARTALKERAEELARLEAEIDKLIGDAVEKALAA